MSLEKALLGAIPFLRTLPRASGLEQGVWAQLAAFRAAHPEVGVDLVVDHPPGRLDVDFDVLLQGEAEGTIAVGWRPDAGMPWSVQYSEHWASSLVLSVNGLDLTIQEVLQALRLAGEGAGDLSTRLVDHCLIATAILKEPPSVSDAEVQGAADGFRAARGLLDAETTERWLREAGLTMERFEALLKTAVQARKLKERIAEKQVAAYFASHAASLAKVTVVRAHSASRDSLPDLSGSAATIGGLVDLALARGSSDDDPRVRIVVETGFLPRVLPSLAPEFTAPPVGTEIGPVRHGGEYWCGHVLRRLPPRLDRETHGFIQERLFESWLEGERAKAEVTGTGCSSKFADRRVDVESQDAARGRGRERLRDHGTLPAGGAARGLDPRGDQGGADRKSTRLNSSHIQKSRMPSSA